MKTRARRLIEDGERPGIWTERSWADPRHPSRFVNVPPPDGLNYRPGPPAAHSIGARVDLSWVMASDTSYAFTDGDTMQGLGVLRRAPAPVLFLTISGDSLFVGENPGALEGGLMWGGYEMQWGNDGTEQNDGDLLWGGA